MNDHNVQIQDLLARAILDLEIKLKHEIRQQNAQIQSLWEDKQQQLTQRLASIESKLDTLLLSQQRNIADGHSPCEFTRTTPSRQYNTRDAANGDFVRPAPVHQHQRGNGFVNRRHPQHQDNNRQPWRQGQPRTPQAFNQQQRPFGHGVRVAAGTTPTPVQKRYASRQGDGPLQTLGTGGNGTPLMEKAGAWTTKVGIYTSDEEDSDGGSKSAHSSVIGYSVAKPAPGGALDDDDDERDDDDDEHSQHEQQEEEEKKVEDGRAEQVDEKEVELVNEKVEEIVEEKVEEIVEEDHRSAEGSAGKKEEAGEEAVKGEQAEGGQVQGGGQEEAEEDNLLAVLGGGFGKGRRN